MKIWYGTILVTTVVLSSYLVIVIDKNIPAINQNIADSQESIIALQEQLAKQTLILEALQAQSKGKDAGPPKPSEADKRKIVIDGLRAAVTKIADAEANHVKGDLNAAAEILKGTKEPIWKAGDVLSSQQATLRAQMGVIDSVIGEWKKGNKAADTSKVSTAIKTILQKLDSPS